MSPFWTALSAALALAAVGAVGRRRPRPLPARDRATPLVFCGALAALILRHQWLNPTWTPSGADWDTWFQSAASMHHGLVYPHSRWPLYGSVAAALSRVSTLPLFVSAQLVSLIAAAGSTAAVFRLTRGLLGTPAALSAAVLCLGFPLVLVVGSWTSAYALWGCSAAWCVAGGAEALRTRRSAWWVVCGLGLAGVLAAMPKGLPLGLALGTLWLLGMARDWRRLPKNAALLAGPVVVTALLYAHFPVTLQSLDDHIRSVESGQTHQRPAQVEDTRTGEGYVFGQSMAPSTITGALQLAGSLTRPELRQTRLEGSVGLLGMAYPTVGRWELIWLASGAGLGLLGGLLGGWSRLCGWLGAVGAVLAGLPSLLANLNLRFLLPGAVLAPIALVAPLAFPTAGRIGPARWVPLLLVGAVALPGSPWYGSDMQRAWEEPVLVHEPTARWLHHTLTTEHPGAVIHGVGPPAVLLLVVAETGGELLIPELNLGGSVTIPAEDLVLRWVQKTGWATVGEGFRPTGPPLPSGWKGLGGRSVLKAIPILDNGEGLVLLGPAGG